MKNLAQQFYQEINEKYDRYIGGNNSEKIVSTDNKQEMNKYNSFVNRISMGSIEATYQSLTKSYKNNLKMMHDDIIPSIETLHAKDNMDYPLGYKKAIELYRSLPPELNFPQDAKSKEMLYYFTVAHEMAHAHYPEKNVDPYVNKKLNQIQITYTSKNTFEQLKNEMRADAFAYTMLKDKYQNEPQYQQVVEGIEKIRLSGSLLGMSMGDSYNFIKLYENNSKFVKELPPLDSKANANEITRRTALQSLNTLKEYGVFVSRLENKQEIINEKMRTPEGRNEIFRELTSRTVEMDKALCEYAENKTKQSKVDNVMDDAMKNVAKQLKGDMSEIVERLQTNCENNYDIEYNQKNNLDVLLTNMPIQAIGVSKTGMKLDLQSSVANFYKTENNASAALKPENGLRP